ncbi:class I SAM-dependent RNA methyltransferase [Oceaniovalibus sp. ACAM 378]|uniref:THUMP domain-containing class I SAM-dependent RNA methyltransferase n=1 Tax=Oceaniovalibus sp. ACAM 378 TaxID=2599923 RepID=UPI0011D7A1B4|nr:class I SAM-dependent RNA methyltransferase [Oceaniovalibus sp. ACAM 378]TYB87974.1 class I SAM-dependent RNA methyltransferase [Oceaniovalibus sp. ACAM 378]
MDNDFEIFLTVAPGLEQALAEEARTLGFADPVVVPGGVTVRGGWPEVWRANIGLRGASRVLARVGSFRVMHLAQLDKRSRRFDWSAVLRKDVPVKVEATCRKSRIYHAGAAVQRIETALRETHGITLADDAPIRLMARIEDDLCTFSLDTSGESLHKRGHKQAVGKAPMRETLAALFLRQCGFDGTEPVVDPMCGSGTFVIEAAEIARGLMPGRDRDFAFERLAGYDEAAVAALKLATPRDVPVRFYGYDRDTGAIRMATANADRAGVGDLTTFAAQPISDLVPPEGPPGLVMINPPYGARIGERKLLFGLYATLGKVLSQFHGWRVGIVTSDAGLAKATGLPFLPPGPPVAHGGLKVHLFRTNPLR